MKSIIKVTIALLIFIFIIGTVQAGILFPLPVNGRIESTANVDYQTVEIKNLRTGITVTTVTGSNGEYLYDWANSDDKGETITKYIQGDQFQIKVLGCSEYSNDCTKVVTLTNQPEIFIVWDLSSISLTKQCPPAVVCPDCSCSSSSGGIGVIYKATQELCDKDFPCQETTDTNCEDTVCASCPEPEQCSISADLQCPEPVVCPEEKECPSGIKGLVLLIGAIMLSIGGGIQIYRNRAGGVTVLHRHRGILGYHNPDTQHRNPIYRHAKFSEDPAQFTKDVKKIEDGLGVI